MKQIISILFLLLALNSLAQQSFLHRDGKILRDSTGTAIKIRGVNLGGWLLWEEWIWGGGFHSQTDMLSGLGKIVALDDVEVFERAVYRNFITEEDIKQIAANKFNVVRIPFNHRLFEPRVKDLGWEVLDKTLGWCKKYGVYAVLDMHGAPGGQSPYFIADPEKKNLWKDTAQQTKTIALWQKIAERYKNNSTVAGYDLLNEPVPGDPKKLLDLYSKIIAAIRKIDNNHLVFLEGTNFAKNFDIFKKLPDEKIVFEFHLYTWLGGDPAKKIAPFINLLNRLNAPVWCGEWGENTPEIVKQTKDVYESVAFSGWCIWTWKKVMNRYPALVEIKAGNEWKKLIEHIQKPNKNPAPTEAEALKGMQDFLSAIKMQNCVINTELMKIINNF